MLAWNYGERPDWWHNPHLIWEFVLPSGRVVVTTDLDQAAHAVADALNYEPVKVLETFGTHLSSEIERTFAPLKDVTATAYQRASYLRAQVERLRSLEAGLAQFKAGVVSEVVSMFRHALKADLASAHALLDANDTHAYLGATVAEVKQWSSEAAAWDVSEFLRAHRQEVVTREGAEKEARAKARPSATGFEELAKQHEGLLRRWLGYFAMASFVGENEHENRAYELHKQVQQATSAKEEAWLAQERDAYLIQHVISS